MIAKHVRCSAPGCSREGVWRARVNLVIDDKAWKAWAGASIWCDVHKDAAVLDWMHRDRPEEES